MVQPIKIIGARTHNLKNISLDLPRNTLIVITGVSGSGKSSLAFDTLYAEGQRRYVESLSAYARQFLERMDRPDVDEIRGIAPAVAIEQKNTTKSSRSTVGTATEIQDYLRLLYARIGRTFCPSCGDEIRKDQIQDVVRKIEELPEGSKIILSFTVASTSDSKDALNSSLKAKGFFRVLFEDKVVTLDKLPDHIREFDVVVDRVVVDKGITSRLADSIEICFSEGNGRADVHLPGEETLAFSQSFSCTKCAISFLEPEPSLFSFNHPVGACPTCKGFGDIITIDEDLVIPDKSKSIAEDCIAPWNTPTHHELVDLLMTVGPDNDVDIYTPYDKLHPEAKRFIWEGNGTFPGINGFFNWLESKKYKIGIRVFLSRYRSYIQCSACRGYRLQSQSLNVRINGVNIGEFNRFTLKEAKKFIDNLRLTDFETTVTGQILKELKNRLDYLNQIGLEYLTLDRRTATLSGGEFQRINLATALGAKLVGALYILDEPTIGLHPRDNKRLISILQALRDIGNTVIVVEHDRDMMRHADQIIDLGPRAGENGGEIIFQGTFEQIRIDGRSLTGAYLRGNKRIPLPDRRRKQNGQYLVIEAACEHNLKNLNISIPLGMLVLVTGVSGSGKSTLLHDVIYAGLMKKRGTWKKRVGQFKKICGEHWIDDLILVDQSPIGKTPRSNPATYIKAFDAIRQVFAASRRAKVLGLKSGAFSFNVPGGRCETCQGAGVVKVEMQFLADLFLQCDSCGGMRYRHEILDIHHRGKNIFQVLEMTVNKAMDFFQDEKNIIKKLQPLKDVGLDYIKLGQPATTLSGGEAQRVKLAARLDDRSNQRILYILDEPTTGLHFDDVAILLHCFDRLINAGHSLLIIEHNMDVIKCADYIIDLGPGGGEAGGRIVATGTPEQVAAVKESVTGQFLREFI